MAQEESELPNGLALCDLHHTLFDRGALGLEPDRFITVSPIFVATSDGAQRWAEQLRCRPLRGPKSSAAPIELQYLEWHRSQVFRGAFGAAQPTL